jgi:hypothetical protein
MLAEELLECAACGRPLQPTAAWKGHGERFYCNEFCAEADDIASRPLALEANGGATALRAL